MCEILVLGYMQKKVVIIGVSYSSRLALARSISVLGCDITVVTWSSSNNASKPIDGYSKYVSRVLFCKKEEKAFICLLKKECVDPAQKVVLIPDCDFSVTMVDLHQDELSQFFLMPHINHKQGAIVEWSDKAKQKELAVKIGMKVANSMTITISNGDYVIPQDIHYPCFPKAQISVAGGKAGMFCCEDEQDLEKSLQNIIMQKTPNAKVMVEDYMDIENEYAVLGFSNGQDVSIPAVIRFIEGSKAQKGIALQGKIMSTKGFEGIVEHFKSFIQAIGYVGLFDIDFYQSSGFLFFNELNLRFGGSGYAIVKMGVNLPAMLVKTFLGIPIENMNQMVEGEAVFTNERICINDYQNGFISVKEYRSYIKSADILFIKDEEDRHPLKAYRYLFCLVMIKSIIKKIILWKKWGINVS